jgi:hypothetical protein
VSALNPETIEQTDHVIGHRSAVPDWIRELATLAETTLIDDDDAVGACKGSGD